MDLNLVLVVKNQQRLDRRLTKLSLVVNRMMTC